jgi:hypothetical protein
MEKAGGLFKNEGVVEKGQQKRAEAGNDQDGSSGNTDSYGSSGNNDNNY